MTTAARGPDRRRPRRRGERRRRSGTPPPRTSSRRAWLVGAALTVVALAARATMFGAVLGGDALPLGPDAEDWVLGTAGWADGDRTLLQPNRYPLYPWLGAALMRTGGIEASAALLGLSLAASALTPWITFAIARRFLGWIGAAAIAGWVALAPAQLVLGVSTIAYTAFAAGFLLVAAALFGAGGRGAPVVAAAGAALAVASLNQGLLCVLTALPAAALLWERRAGWAAAGALAGAGAGLAVVYGLHPQPTSPTGWLLAETARYLGGNIAEETARAQASYVDTWALWAGQTFRLPALGAAGLLAAGTGGLVWACAFGPARRADTDRGDPSGDAIARQGRRRARALAWLVAPSAVLVVAMGSGHHLIHLVPLLALVVALPATCAPGRAGLAAGAGLAAVAVALSVAGWGDARTDLRQRGEHARRARAIAAQMVEMVGADGLVLVPPTRPGDPAELVLNLQWALPAELALVQVPDRGGDAPMPPVEAAIARGATVGVISAPGPSYWATGPYEFAALGPRLVLWSRPAPDGGGSEMLMLYQAAVRRAASGRTGVH